MSYKRINELLNKNNKNDSLKAIIRSSGGLNISTTSIDRNKKTFLTPQRLHKQGNQQSKKMISIESPNNPVIHATKKPAVPQQEKVMIDRKTYEDIMNYLIRVESRRMDKDKQLKRPSSGMKKG